jgi:hypothetical protein
MKVSKRACTNDAQARVPGWMLDASTHSGGEMEGGGRRPMPIGWAKHEKVRSGRARLGEEASRTDVRRGVEKVVVRSPRRLPLLAPSGSASFQALAWAWWYRRASSGLAGVE